MELLRTRKTDNYDIQLDVRQQWELSDAKEKINQAEKTSDYNKRMINAYEDGENSYSSINYDYHNDPTVITEQKFEKMYAQAKYNYYDGVKRINDDVDNEEIQEEEKMWNEFSADHPVRGDYLMPVYPGSTQGPLPEHNPHHY